MSTSESTVVSSVSVLPSSEQGSSFPTSYTTFAVFLLTAAILVRGRWDLKRSFTLYFPMAKDAVRFSNIIGHLYFSFEGYSIQ